MNNEYSINDAIVVYSHSMGNRQEELVNYCENLSLSTSDIKSIIDQIQQEIFAMIWDKTKNQGPLLSIEIENLTISYCKEKYDNIDQSGIEGLLQWLIWMSWHEGCLSSSE